MENDNKIENEWKWVALDAQKKWIIDAFDTTDKLLILQEDDPREKSYDLGIVDVSPQVNKGMDKKYWSCMWDSWEEYKNACNDFVLLGISWFESTPKDLELWFYTYKTPNVKTRDSNYLFKRLKRIEENYDKFESEHNLSIWKKEGEYIRKCYIFAKALEEVVEEFGNNHNYFAENASKITDKNIAYIKRYIEKDSDREENKKKALLDILHKKELALLLPDTAQKRLLNNDDLEKMAWEKVRWKTQHLISRHTWHIEDGGIIYIQLTKAKCWSSVDRIPQEKSRPSIGGDDKDLHDILQEWWYILEHSWRSWFAARNSYIVSKKEPKTQKISAPLIICGGLEKEMKESLWLEPTRTSADRYIVWTGEIFTWEIILDSEFEEMEQIIDKARDELNNRNQKEIIEYIESVKQGNIAMINVWWNEKFTINNIPKRYKILAENRIANTQDHRQNRSHTYKVILLDTENIKNNELLVLNIPNEYKWIIIGKWWANIKRLSEELWCKISIQ